MIEAHLSLKDWENKFLKLIPSQLIRKAGVLLPLIPDHFHWDDYLLSVQAEWEEWKRELLQYPFCLLVLYSGLAYYEYDENRFWPQFAKSVGSIPFQGNQQREINTEFAKAARKIGLELKYRENGTDFVGSAIQFIGIPLSLWDGFLDICEWALWQKDWRKLSDEEWNAAVERCAGGRKRLKKFLTDNRETASSFVQEMLELREILTKDAEITIGNIAQASILRVEYFDEVPETTEFLRPQNPDSLFQDRARLIWNEQRKQISLQLPSVEREKLPAAWRIGAHSQTAANTPDALTLNSDAFHDPLLLSLDSGNRTEKQRLRGLPSWGLFDMESSGRLVNPRRDELPIKRYTLITRERIEILREGFDEEENPVNEQIELADGATCFVTCLWPTGNYAEVRINEPGQAPRIVRFRARSRIEARFFVGLRYKAAFFDRLPNNRIKMDHLPILCVAVPDGYFRNSFVVEVVKYFKVLIDGKAALGRWKKMDIHASVNSQFYSWHWNERPLLERKQGPNILKSFDQMREVFKSPDLGGNHTIVVEALPYIHVKFDIVIVHRKKEIDRCWRALPGAFLPMFLLCQSTEGMKWEDLMLARDVIAHDVQLSHYLLRKYEYHGFLVQRGPRWFIKESRAEMRSMSPDRCLLKYCGDPSLLWGLYRRLSHEMTEVELPSIEVVHNRGEIPYLQTIWPIRMHRMIEQYFKNHQVVIGTILWTH